MSWLESLFDPGVTSGWDILWAVLFSVAGWIASIFISRGVAAVLRKTPNVTEGIAVVAARVVKYVVILLGVGIALSFLGASLQPVLAITLIVAVVLVLALRGIADNFAAGIVVQTRHPISLGDEIEVAEHTGKVTDLNGRSVVLQTVDGRTIHVPNSTLLSEPIINHSHLGARRGDVQVRIHRPSERVPDVLIRLAHAAAAVDGVHAREPAHAEAVSISADRVIVRVRFWHHPLKANPVTSAVVIALADAIESAGYIGTVTSHPGVPPLTPPDPQ